MFVRNKTNLLAALLGLNALAAQAAPQLNTYAAPNNWALSAVSSGGAVGVSGNGTSDVLFNLAAGSFTPLVGGVNANGVSGNGLTLSANAMTGLLGTCRISGVNYSDCALRQAAKYNTSTGAWTTLGSLGYQSGTVISPGVHAVEQSSSSAISSNGEVVVGQAWYGASTPKLHPVVYRDGQVMDLNVAGGTSQTGKANSVSGDGSVVSGFKSNSAVGSIWTWNGSAYVESAAPMVAHPLTGVLKAVAVDRLSDNGIWAAGGSVNALAINYGPAGTPPPYTVTFSPATLWNTQTQTGIVIPFDHEIDTSSLASNPDIIRNAKATVTGVSNSGVVIGSFNLLFAGANAGQSSYDTWIYNAYGDGKSQTFDAYLDGLGLGLAPTQHVSLLTSMSADGSAISGQYFDSATNTTTAFVLHGVAAVPEPATWAQLVLGLGLLGGTLAARRQRV